LSCWLLPPPATSTGGAGITALITALAVHLFDPNRRNLNPMVPAPTTMTVDNTFDFKAYDY
jgi:hypothetical protein